MHPENIFLAYEAIGLVLFLLTVRMVFDEYSLADVVFMLLVCITIWPIMVGGALCQIFYRPKD